MASENRLSKTKRLKVSVSTYAFVNNDNVFVIYFLCKKWCIWSEITGLIEPNSINFTMYSMGAPKHHSQIYKIKRDNGFIIFIT